MGDSSVVRLSLAEELELVETVSELVHGGVTLAAAYRLAGTTVSGRARVAAQAIADKLARGVPAATSTVSSIHRVDPMHLAMLRMADSTGDARTGLARARAFLDTRIRLRSQAVTAALYPGFIVSVALAAAIVLLTVVIPSAERLLASGSTAVQAEPMLRHGTVAVAVITVVLGLGVGVSAGLLASRRSHRTLPTVDRLRLRVPIAGRIEALTELLGFCHVLAGLLEAGEPLAAALASAARTVENAALRVDLEAAAFRVAQGHSTAGVLAARFPRLPALRHYFALAEAGGDLVRTVDSLAGHLASLLERTMARIGVLLEPVLVVVAGSVVLTVVLTLVQPLFDLYGSVLP